jgi:LmbE family N-acetylglucosaminyl deacetylase/CheY-like chemotaxis protein
MTSPYRVLVIEDDPDVGEYLAIVLGKRHGMQVSLFRDGFAALAAWREIDPDLVITDIELPGIGGLDLVARLREQSPALPVMVLTGHASVDYAIRALRNQVDEFLVKPVSGPDMAAKATALAETGRRRRAGRAAQIVLAVGAHPDDVEIGVGGLLAAHRAAGDPVIILTLSRGARGGEADDRQHESLAAAEVIGARLFLEDLQDTSISEAEPTVSIIERVVAEVSPTIVYTHSVHDRHQDHRAVHQATIVASRRVPTVACFESPSATVDFRPNRFSSIDGYLDTKLALLACFASQTDRRDYLDPDFVRATARYWSRFGGGRTCEPLEIVRDTSSVLPTASESSALVDNSVAVSRHGAAADHRPFGQP